MKEIPLTRGKVAFVDDDDYGRLSRFRWYCHPGRQTYYARRDQWDPTTGRSRKILMHREILGLVDSKRIDVDHKDRRGFNNQRTNLVFSNPHLNGMNQGVRPQKKTSKFKGVFWNSQKQKWQARISPHRKQIHLGFFDKEEDAAEAYRRAAVSYTPFDSEKCK